MAVDVTTRAAIRNGGNLRIDTVNECNGSP